MALTDSPHCLQRSMGGTAGVMQRKMEELEGLIKKLEEDKAELKQENASLVSEQKNRVCLCVCVHV